MCATWIGLNLYLYLIHNVTNANTKQVQAPYWLNHAQHSFPVSKFAQTVGRTRSFASSQRLDKLRPNCMGKILQNPNDGPTKRVIPIGILPFPTVSCQEWSLRWANCKLFQLFRNRHNVVAQQFTNVGRQLEYPWQPIQAIPNPADSSTKLAQPFMLQLCIFSLKSLTTRFYKNVLHYFNFLRYNLGTSSAKSILLHVVRSWNVPFNLSQNYWGIKEQLGLSKCWDDSWDWWFTGLVFWGSGCGGILVRCTHESVCHSYLPTYLPTELSFSTVRCSFAALSLPIPTNNTFLLL